MSKREIYEQKTEEILNPIMEELEFELVDVEYVKEGSMWYLRAYIDKPGGITVNDCEAVSRRLSDILDEKDFIEDSYVLEVSSPGLGRPLKKEKDYKRNLGKEVAQEGSTSESPIRPISQRSQSQGHDRVHLHSRFSHQADVRTRIRAQPANHHAESARHGGRRAHRQRRDAAIHRWTQSANLRIRGTLQRGYRRANPNHTNHGHRH